MNTYVIDFTMKTEDGDLILSKSYITNNIEEAKILAELDILPLKVVYNVEISPI